MAIHGSKLALVGLPLFILFSSYAPHERNVDKANAAGAPSNDQAAFERRGIKAPATMMSGEGEAGAVDVAELSNAIGEAQEVSDQTIAKLERRGETSANQPGPAA